jgi:hypothetical protein
MSKWQSTWPSRFDCLILLFVENKIALFNELEWKMRPEIHHYLNSIGFWPDVEDRAMEESPRATVAWLCAKGPYQEHIACVSNANPGLTSPDPGNAKAPLLQREVAVTWLAVRDDSTIHRVFDTPTGRDFARLETVLQQVPHGPRNVWLIEGLNSVLVQILGNHFGMDPSFFADYERTSLWRCRHFEPNLVRPLPSARQPEYFFLHPVLRSTRIRP